MLKEYFKIFFFLIIGFGFVFVGLFLSYLLSKKKPSSIKSSTYECGMEPIGSSWTQFNIRYYLFALVYIIFDVEILYLYPWAITYKSLGLISLIEMFIFILILFAGLIYAWRKKVLQW